MPIIAALSLLAPAAALAKTQAHHDSSRSHVDRRAPRTPRHFAARAAGATVRLSWRRSSARDLRGYAISRKLHAASKWPKHPRYPNVKRARLVDRHVRSGLTYDYRVVAFDRAGNRSAPTSPVSVTPIGYSTPVPTPTFPPVSIPAVPPPSPTDRTAPPVPSSLSASPGARQAIVAWQAVAASDLHHYQLYRRLSANAIWQSATLTTATKYVDTGLTNDQTYSYAVSAVDGAGNESARSVVASARPEPAVFSSGPHATLPAGYVYTPNTSCNTGTNVTISASGECYSLLGPTNGATPSASNRTPVLVILHGGVPVDTTAAHASTWGHIIAKARALGWQVAIPLPAYNEPMLVPYLTKMYSDLTTNHFADANRVNLVGFSAGGYTAMMATCAQRPMFNSVAALAGSVPGDAKIGQPTYFPCSASSAKPSLLVLTGDQDQPNYGGCLAPATGGSCDTDSAAKTVWDPFTLALNPSIQAPAPQPGERVLYYSGLHIAAAWGAWNRCASHTYQSDASARAPTEPTAASPWSPGQATRHTWSGCADINRAGKQSEVAFDSMLGGNHMSGFTNATLDEAWAFIRRQN